MVSDETSPISGIKVDGIAILRGLAIATGENVAILPEHVPCHAGSIERKWLPDTFNRALITIANCIISVKVTSTDVKKRREEEDSYILPEDMAC